jgi:CspA family cold shock protein
VGVVRNCYLRTGERTLVVERLKFNASLVRVGEEPTSTPEMLDMVIGTISKIIPEKGIGFITPCAPGADVFFHFSAAVGGQFDQLQEGQAVSFDLERANETPDRPRASKVEPCDSRLLGRRAVDERPNASHPRARHRKPTWRR